MKAQPGPRVSGRYFFPNAALLWMKRMPAWEVISRKVMGCACAGWMSSKIVAAARAANFLARQSAGLKPCLGGNREPRLSITWKPREKRCVVGKPSGARVGRVGDPPARDPAAQKRVRGCPGVRCYLLDSVAGMGR